MSGASAEVRHASCTSTSAPAARSSTSCAHPGVAGDHHGAVGRLDPVGDRVGHRLVVHGDGEHPHGAVVARPHHLRASAARRTVRRSTSIGSAPTCSTRSARSSS